MAISSLASRCAAAAQLALLLALPQLVWRPLWPAWLAAVGGEKNANVLGNAALTTLLLLVLNAGFYALYKLQLPAAEAHRVIKTRPWPWASPSADERARFGATVRAGAALTALNVALTLPLGWLSYPNIVALGYSASVAAFPSAATMAWQLLVFIILEDTLFFWGHRSLHHPAVYAHVHKVHHRFNHSVSIAAVATHPVEYILSNVVPFVAGPTLLGAHCATIYVWIIYRVGETVFHHSGYDFPCTLWSLLPFQNSAEEHDLHHSVNTGNYGSMFYVWDRVCGTHIAAKEHAT